MNARVSKAAAAAMQQAVQQAPVKRIALLEERFELFDPQVIDRAELQGVAPGQYLRELNRIGALAAGMGTVTRMIGANPVVADNYAQEDLDTDPPLSAVAIGNLTTMLAEMCDIIHESIAASADKLAARVQA